MEENLSSERRFSTGNAHTLTEEREHDAKTPGNKENINFSAYAYSRLGNKCTANNDNFYCNGSYMKHFKYEDFKKSDATEKDMGIFAVCCDDTDNDEGCKIVFRELAAIQENLYRCGGIGKVKRLLRDYPLKVNELVMLDAQEKKIHYKISLSLAVMFKNTAVYISVGNSMMVMYKNNAEIEIMKYFPDEFIGTLNFSAKLFSSSYQCGTKFAFCTRGVVDKVSFDVLRESGKFDEPKEMAVNIINNAIKLQTEKNATCLVTKAYHKDVLSRLSLSVMLACAAVMCADIAILIKLFAG